MCVLFMYSHFIFVDIVPLDWYDEAKWLATNHIGCKCLQVVVFPIWRISLFQHKSASKFDFRFSGSVPRDLEGHFAQ